MRPSLSESVVYTFENAPDSAVPEANLIDVDGTLYGTTFIGGTGSCNLIVNSCGTVFSVTPSGGETVLHSFTGPPDGNLTSADLVDVNGTLYGTTDFGGTGTSSECGPGRGCGTVYSITTSGGENVIYSFQGESGSDGEIPAAGLIDVKGTLYGTTTVGGANDQGVVFSVTTGGQEKVLYSFKGGTSDGGVPQSDLTDVKGTLYGTTSEGGTGSSCQNGCGTIFSMTTAGKETVLHSFAGSPKDGSNPQLEGMIDVKGKLYGTTGSGGADNSGTIFSVTTKGKETVLYSFQGGKSDGAGPGSSLTDVKGTLYGTTAGVGGTHTGYGTVYTFGIKSGTEQIIYRFQGGPSDGEDPKGGLIDVGGTLYGTAAYGGPEYNYGVVYALKL